MSAAAWSAPMWSYAPYGVSAFEVQDPAGRPVLHVGLLPERRRAHAATDAVYRKANPHADHEAERLAESRDEWGALAARVVALLGAGAAA